MNLAIKTKSLELRMKRFLFFLIILHIYALILAALSILRKNLKRFLQNTFELLGTLNRNQKNLHTYRKIVKKHKILDQIN